MILAIFHAGGQTRDKKMETICKENTNTISFLLIYGFGAICPFVPLFFLQHMD